MKAIAKPADLWIDKQTHIRGNQSRFEILISSCAARMLPEHCSSLLKGCPRSISVEVSPANERVEAAADSVVAAAFVTVEAATSAHAFDLTAALTTDNTHHENLHSLALQDRCQTSKCADNSDRGGQPEGDYFAAVLLLRSNISPNLSNSPWSEIPRLTLVVIPIDMTTKSLVIPIRQFNTETVGFADPVGCENELSPFIDSVLPAREVARVVAVAHCLCEPALFHFHTLKIPTQPQIARQPHQHLLPVLDDVTLREPSPENQPLQAIHCPNFCRHTGRRIGVCACRFCLPLPQEPRNESSHPRPNDSRIGRCLRATRALRSARKKSAGKRTPVEAGALQRCSIDLTRKLADLRQNR